ncbi:hypothetical protein P8452_69387 [Trifolium repens]|nr:hypothetical protein P8452_69387 [Trifolium repens]
MPLPPQHLQPPPHQRNSPQDHKISPGTTSHLFNLSNGGNSVSHSKASIHNLSSFNLVLFIVQSSMSSTFKSSPCACSPERVACIKRSKPKNWILHKPPWPISFGTHHSKAMFLIYPRGEHIFDTSTESNDDGRALNYGNNGGD